MTYHSTLHNARGGLERPLSENDPYWQMRATEQFEKLMDLVGEVEARQMTCAIEGTWKAVHDAIKELVIRWSPVEPETQPNIKIDLSPKIISLMDAPTIAELTAAAYGQMDLEAEHKTDESRPKYHITRTWADKHLNSDDDLKHFEGGAEIIGE